MTRDSKQQNRLNRAKTIAAGTRNTINKQPTEVLEKSMTGSKTIAYFSENVQNGVFENELWNEVFQLECFLQVVRVLGCLERRLTKYTVCFGEFKQMMVSRTSVVGRCEDN